MAEERMEVRLSEYEQLAIECLMEAGPMNQTALLECVNAKLDENRKISKIYIGHIVKNMEAKGLVITERRGTEKIIQIADDVEFNLDEGVAYVPAPIQVDPVKKLEEILDMFNIKGQKKRNIVKMFAENPMYKNPQGLYNLLIAFKVDPQVAYMISQHYFGVISSMQQFPPGTLPPFPTVQSPTPTPMPPGPSPSFQQPPNPNPIVVGGQPGQTVQYIQTPYGLIPVIILQQPGQTVVKTSGGQQQSPFPIILAEEVIERPVIDPATGEPKRDKNGRVITERVVVRKPVIPWMPQQNQGQQINQIELIKVITDTVKTMMEPLVKQIQGQPQKSVDEEKLLLKVETRLKESIDAIKEYVDARVGSVSANVNKLVTTLDKYFTLEKLRKEYDEKLNQLKEKATSSPDKFRIEKSAEVLKDIGNKFDKVVEKIDSALKFMAMHQILPQLAMVEKQLGLKPGELITTYIREIIHGGAAPTVSEEEKKKIIERIKQKVSG